jgi:FemAB-related protein (PEP-CTERM system-associated)
VAAEGDEWRGVLPLFQVDTLLTGRVLISSPFAVYGGALALSDAERSLFREHLAGLGARLDVQYIELRNAYEDQCVGWPRIDRYSTFVFPLAPRTGDELIQALPKKTRNLVRKALRYPYETRQAATLDPFLDLMARTYHRLGSPIFPTAWFAAIRREFGEMADVREVRLDGPVVAASLNFYFRGEMHTYYAASAPEAWEKSPNNFLYFDHLRWAGEHGFRQFDFGRSKKESGHSDFKRHWATVVRDLPYEILLVRRKRLPDFTPKDPKFQLVSRVWRRLPLRFTRALGPRLIRFFP